MHLISKVTREQKNWGRFVERNTTKRQLQVAKSTTVRVQRSPDLKNLKPSFAFVLFNCLFPFRGILRGGGWGPYGTSPSGNKLLPQPQGCDWRGRRGPERLCGVYFPASASRKMRWLDPSWEVRRAFSDAEGARSGKEPASAMASVPARRLNGGINTGGKHTWLHLTD